VALGLTLVGVIALRAYPLLRAGGAWGYAVDFDEGVYFSAAALVWQGALPYRDFVFVHPPGILWALAPTAILSGALGPDTAFVIARWLAVLLGAANTLLAALIARRWAGPLAGVCAALVYATYAEVVIVERGPFLEPVLNTACLALAACVQRAAASDRDRGFIAGAGIAGGVAVSVKIWAGLWLLFAALALGPRRGARVLMIAAGTAALLIAPVALWAPASFLTDVLWFHAWRPPDGTASRVARLHGVWAARHLLSPLLATAAIFWTLVRGRRTWTAEAVLFAGVYASLVAGFLASATYWRQYNAHLAAAEAVLAGFAFAVLLSALARRSRWAARGFVVVCALLLAISLGAAIRSSRARAAELSRFARDVRARVPAQECLFSFEPGWALAAGRLPRAPAGAPLIVDSYARQLLSAVETGARFASAGQAFQSEASQKDVRTVLDKCRFAALGWRGHWQLSAASQGWLAGHFEKRAPAGDTSEIDLWERTQ
jgi:hypothetical protein